MHQKITGHTIKKQKKGEMSLVYTYIVENNWILLGLMKRGMGKGLWMDLEAKFKVHFFMFFL